MALMPTFYPLEADRKGASPSQYGFVFAIPGISVFFFSPICGKYVSKIGTTLCLSFGYLLISVLGFLFGFLQYIEGANLFTFLSCVFRFFQGLGSSMSQVAAFGILITLYPDKVCCKINEIGIM